jgi:hypothetical protein
VPVTVLVLTLITETLPDPWLVAYARVTPGVIATPIG